MAEANIIENYRPIALTNFQFKIIAKVLVDRLTIIILKIISQQQRSFIKGKQIYECIGIALEALNMLNCKSFKGHVALKFDMKQDFDNIDRGFLIKVFFSLFLYF